MDKITLTTESMGDSDWCCMLQLNGKRMRCLIRGDRAPKLNEVLGYLQSPSAHKLHREDFAWLIKGA